MERRTPAETDGWTRPEVRTASRLPRRTAAGVSGTSCRGESGAGTQDRSVRVWQLKLSPEPHCPPQAGRVTAAMKKA